MNKINVSLFESCLFLVMKILIRCFKNDTNHFETNNFRAFSKIVRKNNFLNV